jgi:hypothetical protein
MKARMLVLLSSMLTTSFAQHNDLIDKLIVTTKEGLYQNKEVTFDNQSATLQIGEWLIPVSKNTLVKIEFENGFYEIEFSLQKGTAIGTTADLNWKRASFALPFNSRQAAKNFIHLFEEITEKENVK